MHLALGKEHGEDAAVDLDLVLAASTAFDLLAWHPAWWHRAWHQRLLAWWLLALPLTLDDDVASQ